MKCYDKYKDSGVQWIGEVPEHWEICKIKYMLSGMQDGTHGTFLNTDEGQPLLSAKNVFEDGVKISNNERTISEKDFYSIISNGYPRKEDILLCCVGTIGRGCIYNYDYPLAFQRSITFLRTNNKSFNKYLLYQLRSSAILPQYDLFAKTSAQSGLYMGAVANLISILPSLSEQKAIAEWLDERTGRIDRIIATREKQIELLEEMKSAVISRAVTKGLNPDAKMKGSGIEWIGEVPEHWEISKIKLLLVR